VHELQDLSLTPNMEELHKNNVECLFSIFFNLIIPLILVVSELISYCKTSNVSVLVHLSSTFLQCSTKWPNVYGRESEDFGQFLNDFPFPSYCKSKLMAEEFLRNDLGLFLC